MPTKASSATKNKGKVFFVAKSSGPLLGRLPLKYLGVLFDSDLRWKFHINNVALKIRRTVSVVARLRHFVPPTT